MSHRVKGAYKLLERPGIYTRFQALLGGPGAFRRFVDEHLRPFEGARVLDVGCGAGTLLDYLPSTVRYAGYDVNPAYIEDARRRHGERGRFFCARVGEEPPEIEEGGLDFVVAVALLHHLNDDDASNLARSAVRLLGDGRSFVSIDPTLHEGQNWLARLMARLDRGGAVRSPDGYRRLLAPHFPSIEAWLLTDMLAIPYSHAVLRGTKDAIGRIATP
jgi:SAM-dependent methyltransferase